VVSTPIAIGAVVAAFGALMAAQWAIWVPAIAAIPGLGKMGLNTPLLLLAAGLALVLRAVQQGRQEPRSRTADILGWVLVLYPALVFSQTLFDANWGLDFNRASAPSTPDNPHPGRPSPNATLAFMLVGATSLLLGRNLSPARRLASNIAVASLCVVTALTGAGYLLGLEQLYRIGNFNRILPSTAAALCLLAMGLWTLRDAATRPQRVHVAELERRISSRVVATLTLVALSAGVAGFTLLRNTYENSVMTDARSTARLNATALGNTLKTSLWFPTTIASRPTVIETLGVLQARPGDRTARDLALKLASGFLSAGMDGVKLLGVDGRLVAQAGQFPADAPVATNPLLAAGSSRAELRWQDGYVLHVEAPVTQDGERIGTVVTQQRMKLFDETLKLLREEGEYDDALVCSRDGTTSVCAPSKLYLRPYSVPMFDAAGQPAYPMSRALLGQTGVLAVRDLRGIPVVAGYAPIGDSGLGLVVKSDVSALYAPLKHQLYEIGLLIAALVAAGTWALRARVKPLLQVVVAEQRRTRTILDTSSDAFIALDVHGRVSDWNREATRLFGWEEAQAIGRPLAELIVPPQHRQAHDQGFARFIASGTGPVINRRTEITGWHRDGYEIPVELSISAVQTPSGFVANAFVRDIRERKEAQHQLEASERRLQEVLGNIPAMVGRFDREERCLFANELALHVHRLTRDQAIGRRLSEGISEEAYRVHRPHIEKVLAGHRTKFEGYEVRNGQATHYQVNLVPARGEDGSVVGFYLMTFDVTELKQARDEIARSHARLRAITDNLPVMISYIDSEHRLTFANRTFETWTGIPIDAAVGRPLRSVIGDELYEQRALQLRQALRGERVEFEVESEALGRRRSLNTVYVPDLEKVGQARGVYTLTTDVTPLREAERKMAELALNDSLTKLPNRRRFDERLPEAMARAGRNGTGMALIFLDIDRFKQINDTHGHAAGDEVLVGVASRLAASVRRTDFVARLAGDEFVLVLEGVDTADECTLVAQKIVSAGRQPLLVSGQSLTVTTSMGIAYLPHGSHGAAEALLQLADRALYKTKERGRDGFTLLQWGAQEEAIA
jgi:diguanylate cyclase (GGDEF)-like protein/PAS domain S-box-containing protein